MTTRRSFIGGMLGLAGGMVMPWEPKRVYSFPSAYPRRIGLGGTNVHLTALVAAYMNYDYINWRNTIIRDNYPYLAPSYQ